MYLVLAVLHQEEERGDRVARALLRVLAGIAQNLQTRARRSEARVTDGARRGARALERTV